MGWSWSFMLVPLVMAGRVYYFCHWIGDTIMGVFLGLFCMLSVFVMFNSFVPLMQAVAGQPDAFLPRQM